MGICSGKPRARPEGALVSPQMPLHSDKQARVLHSFTSLRAQAHREDDSLARICELKRMLTAPRLDLETNGLYTRRKSVRQSCLTQG